DHEGPQLRLIWPGFHADVLSGLTARPSLVSDLAANTPAVCNRAAGSIGADALSEPPAGYAAMPPAPGGMVSTIMRAAFICFSFHITRRRFRCCDGRSLAIRYAM